METSPISPPQPPTELIPSSLSNQAANPTPTRPTAPAHPPYAEMITAAISTLNDPTGSSKRAIQKYIEAQYSNLAPNHSSLLVKNLKRLKLNGKLAMVKNSYTLPRSVPVPVPASATNGDANLVATDPSSSVIKRRRGRPSKPKTQEPVQPAVPVFSVNPINGLVAPPTGSVRGRGRPRKQDGGVKKRPGRPSKTSDAPAPAPALQQTGTGQGVKKGRGRPRRNPAAPPVAKSKSSGKPRGRPPKPINVFESEAPEVAVTQVAVGGELLPAVGEGDAIPVSAKRRGRPPKAGGVAKRPRVEFKHRNLSGKPVGRPKKNVSATVPQNPNPDSPQLLVAYLDLKGNHENLKSTIKRAADVIKPFLNSEVAIAALEELEGLASIVINAPSNVQPLQAQNPPSDGQLAQSESQRLES